MTQEDTVKNSQPIISGPMLMRKQKLLAAKSNNKDVPYEPGTAVNRNNGYIKHCKTYLQLEGR
eukprot:14210138-Ditylum_brightwellii.AAC.1